MDASLTVSIFALAISVLTALVSAYLAHRQVRAMRDSNYLAVVTNLTLEYRDPELYADTVYMCNDFAHEGYNSSLGISGLPDDVRRKVLNVAYYYQAFAWLITEGVLSRRGVYGSVITRIGGVWRAIEPFALAEREMHKGSFLGSLEATYKYLVKQGEIDLDGRLLRD